MGDRIKQQEVTDMNRPNYGIGLVGICIFLLCCYMLWRMW